MNVELTECLAAAADSAREIATTALAISDTAWLESSAPLPDNLSGIYIPLSTAQLALQFGILAERATCVKLAKALMGMQVDEPLDGDCEVFDAMGEVANMIAGGIKVRLTEQGNINVGLPLALMGKVVPPNNSRSIHGALRMDDCELWLVVTGTRVVQH